MNSPAKNIFLVCLGGVLGLHRLPAAVTYETTSPYHHIQVVDDRGTRTLSFDGSMETRMSLADPSKGHFEYTEYFHIPWLWCNLSNVLMIGLGGASTQRAYQHYYPYVKVDAVDIDATVVEVAKKYFFLKESPTLKVHVEDGRVFLRRSQAKYNAIIMDAYVKNRYGSFIPFHLATKEFFQLATNHLTPDGVLAYNVVGTLTGWQADLLGSVYQTMKSVFPQVYLFPATETYNVVLIGTKAPQKPSFNQLQVRALTLLAQKRVTLPTFRNRVYAYRGQPPAAAERSPILTDDFAPVDGLLSNPK